MRHNIARGIDAKGIACTEADENSSDIRRYSDNPVWSRGRVVIRYMHAGSDDNPEVCQAVDVDIGVVNNVTETDPSNYRESFQRINKPKWEAAMHEEIQALENNHVW